MTFIMPRLIVSKLPEYQIWLKMKTRCQNPDYHSYKNYGARGISVCERWNRFETFYADMGSRPGAYYSLERIENNGNYEPGNCRWATKKDQANNRRTSRFLTYNNERLSISQWAERLNISYATLYGRVVRGNMTLEEILKGSLHRPAVKQVSYKGVTHSVSEWAALLGIDAVTLRSRIQRNMDIDLVFSSARRRGYRSDLRNV